MKKTNMKKENDDPKECNRKISNKSETYEESIKRIIEEDRDLIDALTDM